MEEEPTRGRLKRPLPVDDDSGSDKAPMKKKVRFPKGKKVKPGEEKVDVWKGSEDDPADRAKARLVAKERAMRRYQINAELFSEENRGMLHDITAAEEHYEENETFVKDGIQIEPFNLEKEREEGYFDADGNFVEYVDDNEIKDAWLDNVEVDPKLAEKGLKVTNNEDDIIDDLSSEEIGKIKRRIADVLEPGETVLRALRRLKGTSNNKKEKMSAETQLIFDQLTEDAMKLMENGDYNVYEEKKEVFEREAEGYERLARAREESSSFDMFADVDEHATANPTSDGNNLGSGPNNDRSGQSSENGPSQCDYVYDESSGYYYSSSLGYFYDPSSGLYCCAASGQWYSYNEATGSYDEIQEAASDMS